MSDYGLYRPGEPRGPRPAHRRRDELGGQSDVRLSYEVAVRRWNEQRHWYGRWKAPVSSRALTSHLLVLRTRASRARAERPSDARGHVPAVLDTWPVCLSCTWITARTGDVGLSAALARHHADDLVGAAAVSPPADRAVLVVAADGAVSHYLGSPCL